MNGKGDKLRKGANLKAYYDNYDKIFRKQATATIRNSEEKPKSIETKGEIESNSSPNAI